MRIIGLIVYNLNRISLAEAKLIRNSRRRDRVKGKSARLTFNLRFKIEIKRNRLYVVEVEGLYVVEVDRLYRFIKGIIKVEI